MIWMEGRDPAGAHDCEINIKFHIPRAAPTILPTMGGAVCLFTVKDIAPWLSQYSPRPGRNVIIMLCHVTTIQEMEFHHSSYPLYFGSVFSFTLLERTPLLHSRCHQHCLQCHKHGRVHHLHHHRGGGETLWSWRVLTFKPHYSDSGRSYKSPCGAAAAAKNYPICISTDTIINIIINSIIIINDDHYDHHHHC